MYNAVPPPPSLRPSSAQQNNNSGNGQNSSAAAPSSSSSSNNRRRRNRPPSSSSGTKPAANAPPKDDGQVNPQVEARQNLQSLFDSWKPATELESADAPANKNDVQPRPQRPHSGRDPKRRGLGNADSSNDGRRNENQPSMAQDESSSSAPKSQKSRNRRARREKLQRDGPHGSQNSPGDGLNQQESIQVESSSSRSQKSQNRRARREHLQRDVAQGSPQGSSGDSLNQQESTQAESSSAQQKSKNLRAKRDKKDQQKSAPRSSSNSGLNQPQQSQQPRLQDQTPVVAESSKGPASNDGAQPQKKRQRNRKKKSGAETSQDQLPQQSENGSPATSARSSDQQRNNNNNNNSNATPSRDRSRPKRELFDMYLERKDTDAGIRNGTMYQGTLRINPRRRRMAYVVVDGLEHDVIVLGSRDRNRALQGDTVIVEILGELTREQFDDAQSGSGLIKALAAAQRAKDDEMNDFAVAAASSDATPLSPPSHGLILDECEEDDEDEATLHKIGRVVRIPERRPGMTYSGFLMHPRWKPGMQLEDLEDVSPVADTAAVPMDVADESDVNPEISVTESEIAAQLDSLKLSESNNKSSEESNGDKKKKKKEKKKENKPLVNCFFKPMDTRAPLLLVPFRDCPKDLEENYFTHYQDKLFIATFDRWSHTAFHPYGRLGKLVGSMGEILAETEAILETNCIRTDDFDDKVVKCLPRVPWTIPEDEIAARKDLRETRIFTIDPETARDLDDAVSCVKLPDGNYKIGVHIADVSYFVKPKTALDDEAQKRATTTYLVQKAVPMLPSVLCEDLCSLNPGVDRLAFSVEWIMTPDANIVETWFGRTVIRSCIKMSYENAQNLIDDKPWEEALNGKDVSGKHSRQEVIDDVKVFFHLSQILRRRRFANGALTINQPKLTFRLDDTMHPTHCSVYEIKDSNRLIEEFMLLANISVARKISDYFPEESLLRNHPPPSSKALTEFLDYASRMGHELDGRNAGTLQRSIELIEDEETRQILQLLAIKPMQRASYFCTGTYSDDLERWRHFALNFPVYTHFTSPIRRYADVIVHRLLQAVLDQEDQPILSTDQVSKIARHCNTKKEDARAAQDASSKLFLCVYLQKLAREMGEQYPLVEEAVVMECGEKTFNVYLPRFALDRKVYLEDCDILKVDIDVRRTEMSITWPKEYRGLPPYEGPKPETPPVVQNADGSKTVQFQPAGTRESGKVETIRMLKHVLVRLTVTKKSPLDVKAYLIHPEYSVKPTETVIKELGEQKVSDEQPDECYLLEQFNEVD